MTKNHILFLVFILIYSINNAQTTTILTGLSQQDGEFELLGNDLYIVQKEFDKIIKIDISQSNPTATDVITGLNDPVDIAIINGFAYISETYEDNLTTTASIGKIRKFDLSASSPTPQDVLTNLNAPWHMEAVGNELHFLELNITNLTTFDRNSRISKIDVTNSNPTINTYIPNLGADIFEFIININDIQLTFLGKQEGFYFFRDSNELFRIGFKDRYKNRGLNDIKVQLEGNGIYTIGIKGILNLLKNLKMPGKRRSL